MITDSEWGERYYELRRIILTSGEELIGRAREEFNDLGGKEKGWDWMVFYSGWMQGRLDMVEKVIKLDKEKQ